jgi:hypothetical protein
MADLMAQGDKILKGGVLSFFTGINFEEAHDCYKNAANRFKLEKDWERAAHALRQCVHCLEQQKGSRTEIAR